MTRRNTSQQRAIGAVIEAAGRPLSIPEINELAAEEVPGLGLRTVYRVVDRLLEDGVIAPVPVAGQPDRYELAITSIASTATASSTCTAARDEWTGWSRRGSCSTATKSPSTGGAISVRELIAVWS